MRAWAVAPSQRSVETLSMPIWPLGTANFFWSISGCKTDIAPL